MSVSFLLSPGFIIKSFLFWEQQVSFVSGRPLEAVTWDKALLGKRNWPLG